MRFFLLNIILVVLDDLNKQTNTCEARDPVIALSFVMREIILVSLLRHSYLILHVDTVAYNSVGNFPFAWFLVRIVLCLFPFVFQFAHVRKYLSARNYFK